MSDQFQLAEFLHSDTAVACNIENLPTWQDIENLKRLAATLEEIRRLLGSNPIYVTSGFRCPALNKQVGGVFDSAHLYGYAADFVCPDYGGPAKIVEKLAEHMYELKIDQLIDETGWVHIGLCEGSPRYECFKIG